MSSYLKSLLSTVADEPPDDSDDLHGRLLTRRRLLILFVLLYAAWFMYSQRARHRSGVWGPRWAALFAANVCLAIGRACGLTFTVAYEEDDKLRAKHRGLVAAVGPHGVFPLAMLGFGAFKFRQDLKDCGIGEPGLIDLNARFAGASIVFTVPIIRELLFLMGVRDANRTTLKKLLNAGHTIAIQPGGIWEMVMTDSSQVRARAHAHHSHAPPLSHTPLSLSLSLSQEALYFQRSLGFVRLAMEMGRPLLPCYSFGENQLFKSWGGHGIRLWVARKLRIGLPFFHGRWGLPLCLAPLPTDVTFVVGRHVPTGPPNPNPTDAEVEAVFKRYIDEVCRLFVANAGKYLPAEVAANGLKICRVGHGCIRHEKLPNGNGARL